MNDAKPASIVPTGLDFVFAPDPALKGGAIFDRASGTKKATLPTMQMVEAKENGNDLLSLIAPPNTGHHC